MNDIIRDVINHWDPINLFPLSPKDEYEFEILQIENEHHGTSMISSVSAITSKTHLSLHES